MSYRRRTVQDRRAQILRRPGALRHLIGQAGLELEYPCSACGDPEYDPAAPTCPRCRGTGALLVPRQGARGAA